MKFIATCLIALPLVLFSYPLPKREISIPFLWGHEKKEDISQIDKPTTIRVLIDKNLQGSLIETKGVYHIYNPANGKLVQNNAANKRYFLYPTAQGLKWGNEFPATHQVRFVPTEAECSILVDGIQYKGCVEAYDIDGKINVINELDVENYLRSTLATHFLDEENHEVLDAISIVARTHAYYFIGRSNEAFWDVDARDVGYQGHGLVLQNPRVDESVESTQHVVMTFKNNPFAAAWTKNSGGKTADYGTIFRREIASPHGVLAPFAAKERKNAQWSVSINRNDLAEIVDLEAINAIELFQDDYSAKVYAVRLSDDHNTADLSFFDLQRIIGQDLKSNDFTIEDHQGVITFIGYGEGPGTGLCLYSAQMMAERGEKANHILSSFFPDTRLENLRTYPGIPSSLQENAQVAGR